MREMGTIVVVVDGVNLIVGRSVEGAVVDVLVLVSCAYCDCSNVEFSIVRVSLIFPSDRDTKLLRIMNGILGEVFFLFFFLFDFICAVPS